MNDSHHSQVPQLRRTPWTPELGALVEVRQGGRTLQRGRVEAVMHDGSGFWLAPDGPDHRRYVYLPDETQQVWA